MNTIQINTQGEGFYSITHLVKDKVPQNFSGMLFLYIQHTSCAMTISESFDPSAQKDLENFLKHLAPRNLEFITHDAEGDDDSPSHMKSILLQTTIGIPVEKGSLLLGTWQGVYLCEFRDGHKTRNIIVKLISE